MRDILFSFKFKSSSSFSSVFASAYYITLGKSQFNFIEGIKLTRLWLKIICVELCYKEKRLWFQWKALRWSSDSTLLGLRHTMWQRTPTSSTVHQIRYGDSLCLPLSRRRRTAKGFDGSFLRADRTSQRCGHLLVSGLRQPWPLCGDTVFLITRGMTLAFTRVICLRNGMGTTSAFTTPHIFRFWRMIAFKYFLKRVWTPTARTRSCLPFYEWMEPIDVIYGFFFIIHTMFTFTR
jgi:hypothetical protein